MIEGPYRRTPSWANAAEFWGIVLLSGFGVLFVGLYLFFYFQRGLWAEVTFLAAAVTAGAITAIRVPRVRAWILVGMYAFGLLVVTVNPDVSNPPAPISKWLLQRTAGSGR